MGKIKNAMDKMVIGAQVKAAQLLSKKREGIDGIMVTVGLCIIALVILVTVKDQLISFVTTMVGDMTTKAQGMLAGTI